MNRYEHLRMLHATRIICKDEACVDWMTKEIERLSEPPPMPKAMIVDTIAEELKNE